MARSVSGSSSSSCFIHGIAPTEMHAWKYRWFISHESGRSSGMRSMDFRFCVGIPMTGRWCILQPQSWIRKTVPPARARTGPANNIAGWSWGGNDPVYDRPGTGFPSALRAAEVLANCNRTQRRGDAESRCELGAGLRVHAFLRLGDQVVDHGIQVARALVDGELAVGAGALVHDAEGVLHRVAAPQLVHHVVQEPLQHLADQVARRA